MNLNSIVFYIIYNFILVMLNTECNIANAGPGRDRKVLLKQCDMPTIKNGITRLRQRGKLIKFQCYKSYTLIGSLYAGCVGGKWDTPIPVCAKSGCTALAPPENGFVMIERLGLMVTLFCKEHYKPAGIQTAFCDGTNWNRPIGTCRLVNNETSPRRCDFEVDDLCGWTHDDTHDFEWKRVIGVDNLRKFRTGPQHDHTTMISNAGHYLLVESVNQLPDDHARLISPVYSRNLSINACFQFYYHMYGATVGTLRVYVKPMSIGIDTMIQDQNYLYFEISGNQKNLWKEGIFHIHELSEDFQIVIDGSAGNNHLSDIAIDDVALLNGDECPAQEIENPDEKETTSEIIEKAPLVYDIQSCKNRCDEKYSKLKKNNTASTTAPATVTITAETSGTVASMVSEYFENKTKIIAICDCHLECEDLQSCCPDYRSICVFGITDADIDDSEKYYLQTTQSSDILENNETNQLNNNEAHTTVDIIKPTITITTTKLINKETTPGVIVTKITPTTAASTTKTTITTKTTTATTTTTAPKSSPSSTSSPRNEAVKTAITKDYQNEFSITKSPNKGYSPTEYSINKDFTQDTSSSSNTKESNDIKPPEWTISTIKKTYFIPKWLIIILSTILIASVISIGAFCIIYYRKHYGPQNYKKNSDNANRNTNDEVRYLTYDEHLDFTLQTPETVNLQKL